MGQLQMRSFLKGTCQENGSAQTTGSMKSQNSLPCYKHLGFTLKCNESGMGKRHMGGALNTFPPSWLIFQRSSHSVSEEYIAVYKEGACWDLMLLVNLPIGSL